MMLTVQKLENKSLYRIVHRRKQVFLKLKKNINTRNWIMIHSVYNRRMF